MGEALVALAFRVLVLGIYDNTINVNYKTATAAPLTVTVTQLPPHGKPSNNLRIYFSVRTPIIVINWLDAVRLFGNLISRGLNLMWECMWTSAAKLCVVAPIAAD